jgi:hypothetical protein
MMHALIMDVCASSSIESAAPTILITTQHYNTSNIIDLV